MPSITGPLTRMHVHVAKLSVWLAAFALAACGSHSDAADSGSDDGSDGAMTSDADGSTSASASSDAGPDTSPGDTSGAGDEGEGSSGTGDDNAGTDGPSSWIGVPDPPFGITETADDCARCKKTIANEPGDLTDLAPGTIVEISPSFSCSGNVVISGTGTPTEPIFVRGPSLAQKAVVGCATGVMGSYIIVENIDFDFSGEDLAFGVLDSDHIALRTSDVHGVRSGSNGTVVYLEGSADVVLYQNRIFDNGDFSAQGELDIHGVGGGNVWRVWILDSELYSNRGDSVQFGHQAGNTLGDIYIAGNDMHDNGENSVDIKEASNVVISQNLLHGVNPLGNVVLHDCPVNAAVIYNEIFDEDVGVSMASLESACSGDLPITLFVLRNHFHDIGGEAVQGWGSGKTYFVAGNAFQNVGTPVAVDEAGSGSVITEDDSGLADGFAQFLAVYGIDISNP